MEAGEGVREEGVNSALERRRRKENSKTEERVCLCIQERKEWVDVSQCRTGDAEVVGGGR